MIHKIRPYKRELRFLPLTGFSIHLAGYFLMDLSTTLQIDLIFLACYGILSLFFERGSLVARVVPIALVCVLLLLMVPVFKRAEDSRTRQSFINQNANHR